MSRENSPTATAADSATSSIEKKENAPIGAPAADLKKAAAAETKAAVESGSTPAAAASAKPSDKPAEAASSGRAAEQADDRSDVEMTDAAPDNAASKPDDAAKVAEHEQSDKEMEIDAADATDKQVSATGAPSSAAKRKSIGGAADKIKKLNKKASKTRILHMDAQPGEHFWVKLKGFPQWPVIICDEEMLPESLLKSRPVTARRQDGTYREDYADGAKKAVDRTFPVMYLYTNEFGWVPNSDLIDLDPSTVLDVKMDKMRKDLQAAHHLAAESHPLSYYKDLLQQYQEELIEKEKLKVAKAAAAATPKVKKAKSAAPTSDEDVDMEDAPEDETPAKEKKAKKRKADEPAETPARAESVKKPKIKLTSNANKMATNGASASTPAKSAKPVATDSKSAKSKSKKAKDTEEKAEVTTPKEPELTPKEKHDRKEKEVLFLRHKLQKGLLTRDQEPKESEMEMMSDYITKLEQFPDLEVSIIRVTKINKVLKAILKLDNIPKEPEYKFHARSQVLLEKWNKLLQADSGAAPEAKAANGVNGTAAKTNGVAKESSKSAEPVKGAEETKEVEKAEDPAEETSEPAEKAVAEETTAEAVQTSA